MTYPVTQSSVEDCHFENAYRVFYCNPNALSGELASSTLRAGPVGATGCVLDRRPAASPKRFLHAVALG
jgi:hypothetical protein